MDLTFRMIEIDLRTLVGCTVAPSKSPAATHRYPPSLELAAPFDATFMLTR